MRRILSATLAAVVLLAATARLPAQEAATADAAAKSADRGIGVRPNGTWLRQEDVGKVGDYYALVIAIDRYATPEWRLRTAVADGKAVAKVLREGYGFKEVVELYDDKATLEAIKREISVLSTKVSDRDNVLIYYAGHGQLVGGTGYWIPADGKPGKDWGWLEHIVVRDRIKLSRLKARHVLIVSDSCYAAALFRDAKVPAEVAPEYVQKALRTPSRQCLTSGGLAPVTDGGGGGHSVFAKYFLKCLKKPPRSVFVPSDIMADLKTNVGDNAPKIKGERQVPILGILTEAGGERAGEFVFVRRTAVATVTLPEKVPDTGEFEDRLKRLRFLEAARKACAAAEKIDGMDLPASEKIAAWQAYLKAYRAVGHRVAEAEARLKHWRQAGAVPPWAKVSRKQIEAARKAGVPVAKELALGGGVTMQLVFIAAGEFRMGSPSSEKDRLDNEAVHRVKLRRPFYMGRHEVTQRQWQKVMGTEPWKGKTLVRENARHPAVYINWEDATSFCRKLSGQTGVTVRLPTEAEWEYACRAGSRTRFSHGDDPDSLELGDYAWDNKNPSDRDEKYAHAVGQKKPNLWGLHDMHGNVYEWCGDWYGKDYYGQSPANDPRGPGSGTYRVLRGGSWFNPTRFCRVALRYRYTPDFRIHSFGFRIVVSLD